MEKYLIIVPAYNEEKNISDVIKDLTMNVPYADILVIDDASVDRTYNIVSLTRAKVIQHIFNMGYSATIQTGFKYACINDYDYVIQFDGDGQHIATEINKLIDAMKLKKLDLVIGSRFINNTHYKHGKLKRLGTNIFVFLIKILTKQNISDPTSGFQILSKKVFEICAKPGLYPDYPDANFLFHLINNGIKVGEVPVIMKDRLYGISMHSSLAKNFKYMVEVLYSIMIVILRKIFSINIRRKSNGV